MNSLTSKIPNPNPSSLSPAVISSTAAAANSGSTACCSCRHQRRKCVSGCALAPYFPAGEEANFENAHRIFGVAKILRILELVAPDQRAAAMRAVIFHANARSRDPAGGCTRLISDMQRHIDRARAELHRINQQINCFEMQMAAAAANTLSDGAALDWGC
ncbi:LOB domain-containing protein 22 [Apostasia shenzhenica]|uniref:LOB domain-containing protein 22 n=1 Tax=Apostasia shenzhenica TaxID=1088818 RepID=A0A2I0B771_9ASPA|nr:LOB domain-containing protein 22 [Apostasia shenzhenica]